MTDDAYREAAQEFDDGFNPFIDREDETVLTITERAEEIMTYDLLDGLHKAAPIAALLAAMQETDEELMEFVAKTFAALYNYGRNHAGKDDAPAPDMTDHVDTMLVCALMSNPVEAMFGAFVCVFVEGYES